MPATVDWYDLEWISEDPEGFNLVHDPIQLTEEILAKAGFHLNKDRSKYAMTGKWYHIVENNGEFVFRGLGASVVVVKTLHHLQNLYYALTGEELEVKI